MDDLTLSVYELVGGSCCLTAETGQEVYRRVAAALAAGRRVTLSFCGVTCLTPTFLHAAIGQLSGVYAPEEIRSRLRLDGLAPDDAIVLKRVVETAKGYFGRQ
jgi:hypothetical protein